MALALTTREVRVHNSAVELLTRLLRTQPVVIDVGEDIGEWWRRFRAAERRPFFSMESM